MANANDWVTDLENTVTALVKAKALTQLKKTYPKIVITNEGENSGQAVFPTVYIHLLPAVERGQTLDRQTTNALLATFQVDVATNTSKSDCRRVTSVITDAFKRMSFQGKPMPEFSISNKVHKSTARFSRIIAANDRLL